MSKLVPVLILVLIASMARTQAQNNVTTFSFLATIITR